MPRLDVKLPRSREAPGGFEPPMSDLQSDALATWRRRLNDRSRGRRAARSGGLPACRQCCQYGCPLGPTAAAKKSLLPIPPATLPNEPKSKGLVKAGQVRAPQSVKAGKAGEMPGKVVRWCDAIRPPQFGRVWQPAAGREALLVGSRCGHYALPRARPRARPSGQGAGRFPTLRRQTRCSLGHEGGDRLATVTAR